MLGIGVGIDYALLILTRYRAALAAGAPAAIREAVGTAGRSVLVGGHDGRDLAARPVRDGPDVPLRRGAGGDHRRARGDGGRDHAAPRAAGVRRAADRAARLPGRAARPGASPARWSQAVQRRPWTAARAGIAVLLVLASPVTGLRLGFPDAGNDRAETTTRQAFELVTRTSARARTGRSSSSRRRRRPRASPRSSSASAGIATVAPPGATPRVTPR